MDYKEEIFKLIDNIFNLSSLLLDTWIYVYDWRNSIDINDGDYLEFSYDYFCEPLNREELESGSWSNKFKITRNMKLNKQTTSKKEIYEYFKEKNKLDILVTALQKEVIHGL